MKKKILFVANEFQIGGATNSLFRLACCIKGQYEPLILMNKRGPLTERCDKENINYVILNYKPFSVEKGSSSIKRVLKKLLFPILKLQYIVCNKVALNKADKLINMKEVALIHTNVNRDDFGALLSEKYHIPHVWHLREFGDADYKCYFFRKNHIEFMNKHTDYFIAISNVIKEYFVAKGLDKNKIKVIYNGVQIKENAKLNKDKNLKILFLGGIQESKGQLELIEALHLVPKEMKEKIRVSFYGFENKEYKQMLLKKIDHYHLQNVQFYPFVNNIDTIIQDYNIGIMCSTKEAFGRVIVEYMTNKLITIVPNTGACEEIVTKDTGFVYEHHNYQNLADIIIKISRMSLDERYEIAQNGYERSKEFSDIKNAENIMKLYDKILE